MGSKRVAAKDLFLSLDKTTKERDLSTTESAYWQLAKVEFLKERRQVSKDLKQKARY